MLSKFKNGSTFLKNTAYLISSTAIAQIIGVLATPILSRYYTPADFGYLGIIITITGILSTTGTFRYEMAIVLAKSNRASNHIAILSVLLLVITVGIACILFLVFPSLLAHLGVEENNYLLTILFISLLSIFLGVRNIIMELLIRLREILFLSKRTVVEKVSTVMVQLSFVLITSTGFGLVIGNISGALLGIVSMLNPLFAKLTFKGIRIKHLINQAKFHYRFLVYSVPQNILNTFSQGLPILMLGRYYGEVEVGAYFFSMRLLQLPSALISSAIKKVFYKDAAENINNTIYLKKKFTKLTLSLLAIISGPTIILFAFGKEIFGFVFGVEWAQSGEFAAWMVLWTGLMFVNPPAFILYHIFNKQRLLLLFEIFLFCARFASLYIGGTQYDILHTIKIYSLVGVAFNFFLIGYIFKLFYGNSNRR